MQRKSQKYANEDIVVKLSNFYIDDTRKETKSSYMYAIASTLKSIRHGKLSRNNKMQHNAVKGEEKKEKKSINIVQ